MAQARTGKVQVLRQCQLGQGKPESSGSKAAQLQAVMILGYSLLYGKFYQLQEVFCILTLHCLVQVNSLTAVPRQKHHDSKKQPGP